jgi:hypothetical protein
MNRTLVASVLLALGLYSVTFFLRRQFGVLVASGTVDWIILLLFALIPVAISRKSDMPVLLLAFFATAFLQGCLSVLMIIWFFPSYL